MAALKLTAMAASQALTRLAAAGFLVPVGGGAGRRYTLGHCHTPVDMRGAHPASLKVLREHQRNGNWWPSLCKANRARGVTVRPSRVRTPVATTALEQAWGWLPSVQGVHGDGAAMGNAP